MALESLRLGDVSVGRLLLLFGLVFVGVAYFSYSWFISDLSDQAARQETTLENLRLQVERGKLVEAQLPQFQAQIQQQRAKLQQFRANLPSSKETPQLMQRIQNLASSNNLNIKVFEPQQVETEEFYANWPIQISLEGNYHNLGQFFEGLSRLSRLVNVNDLTIQGLEGTSNRNRTIAATCTATTFVFLDDAKESE